MRIGGQMRLRVASLNGHGVVLLLAYKIGILHAYIAYDCIDLEVRNGHSVM